MAFETVSARPDKSDEDSPEIKARKAMLESVASMSDEELNTTTAAAGLSEAERASMKHWRDSVEFMEKNDLRDKVRHLFFAEKHPTLSSVMAKLNIGLDNPYDLKKAAELDAQEKLYTPYDFEMAVAKMRRTHQREDRVKAA